jgi:hypothetical protein
MNYLFFVIVSYVRSQENQHLKQAGYSKEYYQNIVKQTGTKLLVTGSAH